MIDVLYFFEYCSSSEMKQVMKFLWANTQGAPTQEFIHLTFIFHFIELRDAVCTRRCSIVQDRHIHFLSFYLMLEPSRLTLQLQYREIYVQSYYMRR